MAQKLVLFAANGDSIAETPGSLWDLLANAVGFDAEFDAQQMSVGFFANDGGMRVLSLGPALAQTMDDAEQRRTVQTLRDRAAGYTRLADWLDKQGAQSAEDESEVPEEKSADDELVVEELSTT